MAGRKPSVSWNKAKNQYTVTIDGVFHRLGQDKEAAETQFKFLLRQSEYGVSVDLNATLGDVADAYLDHVEAAYSADRYRHCKERLQEFKNHVGDGMKVKDLRPRHVDAWLSEKGTLTSGTQRLYKSILLACLNWAAKPRSKKGGELIPENPLRGQLHLPAGGSRGKDAVWTQETIDQVLRVASPPSATSCVSSPGPAPAPPPSSASRPGITTSGRAAGTARTCTGAGGTRSTFGTSGCSTTRRASWWSG